MLAKVDVDANPQLSAALQVQSIPMVVAVIDGQLVPGFLGALPESEVREWIGQVMQVAEQLGLPGPEAAAAATRPEDAEGAGQGRRPEARPRSWPGPPGAARRAAGPRPAAAARCGDALADPAFGEAQQAMERGDLDGAAAAFEKVLASAPGPPGGGDGARAG